MITLRRARDRHHDRRGKQQVWLTFDPRNNGAELSNGLGPLEMLNEAQLPPGAGTPEVPRREAELVTYVHEGALTYADSNGSSGVIQAGEFLRMTVGGGARDSEMNASGIDGAHVFQVWLRPPVSNLQPGHEQKRFSSAQRRDGLCVVASPDARRGSLRIREDALLFSAILDPGQHLIHELPPGRSAWLHLVAGEVLLDDQILTTGDGAAIIGEPAVSLTAREKTEVLLVDLSEERATGLPS